MSNKEKSPDASGENRVLISLLGAGNYSRVSYRFPGSSPETVVTASYAAESLYLLDEARGIPFTHWIILGTESSSWGKLVSTWAKESGLADPADLAFLDSCAGPVSQDTAARLAEIAGHAFQASGRQCRFIFLVHSASMATSGELLTIFSHLTSLTAAGSPDSDPVLNRRSRVTLDISNGMRFAPMISFISLLAIQNTEGFTLDRVCCSQLDFARRTAENTRSPGDLRRVDALIGRLRHASRLTGSAEEVLDLFRRCAAILNRSRGRGPSPAGRCTTGAMYSLDSALDHVRTALLHREFMSTGNLKLFAGKADLRDPRLAAAADSLSFGSGSAVLENSAALQEALSGIREKNLRDFLEREFSWITLPRIPALKSLSQRFLAYGALARAICAMNESLNAEYKEYKAYLSGSGQDGEEQTRSQYLKDQYGNTYDDFTYTYRSMLYHMADEQRQEEEDQKKSRGPSRRVLHLREQIISTGPGQGNRLQSLLGETFQQLGMPPVTDGKPGQIPAKRLMVTFMGGGSYEICDYRADADGQGDRLITDSIHTGVALAGAYNFDALLICGTETSNWSNLIPCLADAFPSFGTAAGEIIAEVLRGSNFTLPEARTEEINARLQELPGNCRIQLLLLPEELCTEEAQEKLFRNLDENSLLAEGNCRIWMDITHSLRQLPVLAWAAILYLRNFRNLEIDRILYGVLDDDIREKSGLSQEFDKLRSGLGSLKNADMPDPEFQELLGDLESAAGELAPSGTPLSPEKCTGRITDMTDLMNFWSWTEDIALYTRTRKFSFLSGPLSRTVTSAKDREKILKSLLHGDFLANITRLKGACKRLGTVRELLKSQRISGNSALEYLRRILLERLSWIDDTEDRRILYASIALSYASYDSLKALLYMFEAYDNTDNGNAAEVLRDLLKRKNVLIRDLAEELREIPWRGAGCDSSSEAWDKFRREAAALTGREDFTELVSTATDAFRDIRILPQLPAYRSGELKAAMQALDTPELASLPPVIRLLIAMARTEPGISGFLKWLTENSQEEEGGGSYGQIPALLKAYRYSCWSKIQRRRNSLNHGAGENHLKESPGKWTESELRQLLERAMEEFRDYAAAEAEQRSENGGNSQA